MRHPEAPTLLRRRRGGGVRRAAAPLLLLALLIPSVLIPSLSLPAAAENSPAAAVLEALRQGESAQMRGEEAAAIERYRGALEKIALLPEPSRADLLPEAELLLRRLHSLAGDTGAYAGILPDLERWGSFDAGAPAAAEPLVASLARFIAGAAALYTGAGVDGARSTWAALGFLERWWIIGPFDNERGGGFAAAFGPEGDRRPVPETPHPGKSRQVFWRRLPAAPLAGGVDLDALLRANDQALAYALTFVECERSLEAVLRLGSDEGFRLWINGEEVLARDLHRRMRFDQDAAPVRLRAGWNAILLKVAEAEGRWEFRARLTDRRGAPLEGWREADPPADADLPPPPAERRGARSTGGTPAEAPAAPAPVPSLGSRDRLRVRIEAEPGAAHHHYLLGALLEEVGAHDEAEHPDREALDRAVKLHPDPAPSIYHYILARASRREIGIAADRDDNAWREALEAAGRGPEPSALALADLARHYLETFGNLERAAALAERALAINPRLVEARLSMGRIDERRRFPRAFEKAIDRCLEDGLESPELAAHRAAMLRRAGRHGEAEEVLRRALSRSRRDIRAREALLDLCLDQGRTEEALALLGESARLHPFEIGPRRRMRDILRGAGDLEGALEIQRDLTALAPGDHVLQREEGDLLWQLGLRDQAFAAWDLALSIQPNYPELRERADFLRSRRDPFVEEFRRDADALIAAALEEEPRGDDPAEVLLDLTALEVHPDGTVKEFRQQALRILTPAGAEAYDRYHAYYAEGDQRLEYKAARVVHRDGREERARLGVHAGGAAGSGEYRAASIDLPPLVAGDVVEVQYVVEDVRQSFFGDYFGRLESFQGTLPMREKTFVLRVPAERKFQFHQRRLDLAPRVEEDSAAGRRTYTWTRRDIPKLRPEPGMPPRRELDPLLAISTFATWGDFSAWYWNLIRKQFESSPEIAAKVRELTSGKDTEIERIRALYHFVVQEVRYNAWEFGVHGFKPYNAPAIFSRRFGDCKDKATLLTVMLEELGIPSYPVLIHAVEPRGEEDLTLPLVNHFNHCITYIPPGEGREGMYLDGTAQHNGLLELPAMDRGARVLVVRPGGGSVETIPWNRPEEFASEEEVQVALREDGGAELAIRLAARGDLAAALRRFFEIPARRRLELEKILGRRFAGAVVKEESFSDLARLDVPVELRVRLEVPGFMAPSPEGPSIRPVGDFFRLAEPIKRLSALDERALDLLLGAPTRSLLTVAYKLPGGYRAKTLPEGAEFQDRFGRLQAEYEGSGGAIRFRRLLETTAPRAASAEYPRFRELAAALERLETQKIVLEKKPAAGAGAGAAGEGK